MKIKTTEHTKQEIKVAFEQIIQKCKTVGELQKLNEEINKLKELK